jgi:PhnB protein
MTITPYLTFKDAASAIDFYTNVFGASELSRLTDSKGKIGHAEIKIGDSTLMLSDESPASGALSPLSIGGSPIRLHLSVEDVDAVAKRLVDGGAAVLRAVKDEFYGERIGLFADPFGYSWFVASKIEDVSAQEAQNRWDTSVAR